MFVIYLNNIFLSIAIDFYMIWYEEYKLQKKKKFKQTTTIILHLL